MEVNAPCICGSGRKAKKCCLRNRRVWNKAPINLSAGIAGPSHAHSGCYLRFLGDCSTEISGEHYISEAVLRLISHAPEVSGLPWLAVGESRRIGIGSLKAKVLCKRHNSFLAPLDAEAGRLFGDLQLIGKALTGPATLVAPREVLFNGHDVERWMLKTVCGLVYSENIASDGGRLSGYGLSETHVEEALLHNKWPPNTGMYFEGKIGEKLPLSDEISFAPVFHPSSKEIAGALFGFLGWQLVFVFDVRGFDLRTFVGEKIYRPRRLNFFPDPLNGKASSVIFSWNSPVYTTNIKIQIRGTQSH